MNFIGTDSETFVEKLYEMVMEDQKDKGEKLTIDTGDSNEKEELSPFIIKHWLNFAVYYEKAATHFIGGWLKTTEKSDALVDFAHQIEDEANHYVWLRKYLADYVENPDDFTPPREWVYLMEEYYPGLKTLEERLAAHNIASESAALGFMEFALDRLPEKMKKTIDKISKDEFFHVTFGKTLLKKYCVTEEEQQRAYDATVEAMRIMREAREVFVNI
ncbi:ferritin-like domain-containing protein [Staphylococcus saccharolyticus]|jgi:rubrerythrin|uniref:Protein of uncharacterized function (DUF455) n=1 Tax=Staphylococcus saccharolyticus TaxID=33028 RepID=A0A380JB44_9STAP|nr:ferritin-like domain-containing protein [Staphylococcus saccharolyticus]MBL7566133.1 ferritin-like domain-containing protein [Staphylococcus saccharolyticus]MBL7571691.1 ferritin-like domain-containing protein [Staphylococcus saccharolyticus]QRJ67549.1 ferritin-like domain-containing protein [Staphylococcus saccharolyticus]RTX97648.1 ferritin-like domain-containing protein [Staphylococcus saccharolyticus]TAA98123.1 hypothetical protein DMB72_06165 [Staphylococcus saccharolyticus]